MKKTLRYNFLLVMMVLPLCTFAGWPIGKYRNLVVPSFNYYTAKNTFDTQGKKVNGVAGSGFDSYGFNIFFARGLSRRLDLIVSVPFVYQTNRSGGVTNNSSGATDLTAGLSYLILNNHYERFLSAQLSAIAPLYSNKNTSSALGYGSYGSEAKISFSGNIAKHFIKGAYFNTEIYYRRYFNQDGPNQYGAYVFFGYLLSKSNQVTLDAVAIKSVSDNKSFNQNITSIKDFSLIKPSLSFGHRFNRRLSMFVGGYYTVAGRNTAIGYGTNVSAIFHL
ncbi:hypothetical protein [Mucilaginibacter glaciei]|uniref:Uncharacterized protein n=1 Tax=Mucilaginibacter glaciei TaxID=2772109 RepID=A0A926S6W9_9SPHI|nr:hypothetical protein [Mucilaginibacter glaciei]MBD1394121.1 hypothetical protein [Mucilaginibacter glaciei]